MMNWITIALLSALALVQLTPPATPVGGRLRCVKQH